ncbi:MAG: C_GCAxxG_C_C family protein [Clostridiales bacterium]|nr:C_GCAxxG_C_C family protein [Clostridiales bacterium]
MSRAERAKEYFRQGFACSQAVALAFLDVIGMDETTVKKITLPFGGGLGRLRLTCGAVSGMAIVIGAVIGTGENSPENKKAVYQITQELCAEFKEKNGSLICEELLTGANIQTEKGGSPEKRTQEYYKKRPCAEIVFSTAEILEKYLMRTGKISPSKE